MTAHLGIWLSWERHTRSRSLSECLDVPLHEIVVHGNRLKRYVVSLICTVKVVKQSSTPVIFFQNPSLVLSVLLVFMRPVHKKILVMDAHNAGILPLEGRSRFLNFVAKWVVANVDITIVTNGDLANKVLGMGGNPFVLTDPIPTSMFKGQSNKEASKGSRRVIFVCTWAYDEPYLEVIRAAKFLEGKGISVHATGKVPSQVRGMDKPTNFILEGFLSSDDYIELMCGSDLVLDLTSRNSCLVCGAYEAIASETPGVLSNNLASRTTFSKGFMFTENNGEQIAETIQEALYCADDLRSEIIDFKANYLVEIKRRVESLKQELKPLIDHF
ncbi:glycosyltransferase family protein [Marinobacter bohaiensis]|uniref:glycosyltransferase n=1 Tax=Marinobacter bohaiensis TaxID=2201898 RepID=UPI0013A6A6A0|nr:glycosyltransferase [Marinobacter bohaiensis]